MSKSCFKLTSLKRINKVNYFSYKVWRVMYLVTVNPVHHTSEKKLKSRSSVVPSSFRGTQIIIHSGKRWHIKYVSKWLVGFKIGEFTWNRRYALYKAKQLRKKNKKKTKK